MPQGIKRISALFGLSTAAFLAGCATTSPDYAAIQAEGTARQVPLIIHDTSWNNPRGRWNNRHMGQPVPPGWFYMGLMNTHAQDIKTVMVYVARCGAKAARYDGNWLMLKGPFTQDKDYTVIPVPIGIDVDDLLPWNQVNHLLIDEVRVEDTDGKTYDYTSDVGKVLAPGISNYCATNV
jgi:hypothetical protein